MSSTAIVGQQADHIRTQFICAALLIAGALKAHSQGDHVLTHLVVRSFATLRFHHEVARFEEDGSRMETRAVGSQTYLQAREGRSENDRSTSQDNTAARIAQNRKSVALTVSCMATHISARQCPRDAARCSNNSRVRAISAAKSDSLGNAIRYSRTSILLCRPSIA